MSFWVQGLCVYIFYTVLLLTKYYDEVCPFPTKIKESKERAMVACFILSHEIKLAKLSCFRGVTE